MKILIVEDNDRLRKTLTDYMEDEGFAVDSVDNGLDALHMGLRGNYDLILLDVMLPSLYGWDVLKALRGAEKTMPILMLSARDQLEDQLQSANMGADDYITKPFDMNDLVARIHLALRPKTDTPDELLRMGSLTVNAASKVVAINGKPVELAAPEYALLEVLMQAGDREVSRYEIIQNLLDPDDSMVSITLDSYIYMLRQKIGQHRIQTRGSGYQMMALDYDMAG